MKDLKIRLIKNQKELKQVFKIRETVFIKGQDVPLDRERDKYDMSSRHFIVIYKNKPVGCARVRFIGKKAKLERMAILKKYRGKGFGMAVIDHLINYCRRKRAKEIVVHSQCHAKEFYKKCGFKAKGRVFMDAGIKHICMGYK